MREKESSKKAYKPAVLSSSCPEADLLLLGFSGDWRADGILPSIEEAQQLISSQQNVTRVTFDVTDLGEWDSGLLVFLVKILDACSQRGYRVDQSGLPEGVRKLLDLASPQNQRKGVAREEARPSFLVRVADATLNMIEGTREMLAFLGEATVAFLRMLRGNARFRRSDLIMTIQESGAQALPIVSLISVLVGIILAFVAAIQLKLFGAQIYVANVVGIGMVRVLGAVMTGIIMAGRTGAAFAAQLGTMQVNEEIDALETLGFSPAEFLVLPRMLALMLMMPLLCIYADFMGSWGG
jgi:phospholipid/cholesterol/gamma-HCH transport system permease protein